MKSRLRILQDADHVLLLHDGRLIGRLPWQTAQALSGALRSVASQAEEWSVAERIAADQALLLRRGVPLGLTNSARIRAAADQLSQWDRSLRRIVPATRGISSKEAFGVPEIRNAEKTGQDRSVVKK